MTTQEHPEVDLPHIEMSWNEVEEAVANLLGQFKEDNYIPKAIVGIAKGGIIPASLIHQAFPKAVFYSLQVSSYDEFFQHSPRVIGDYPEVLRYTDQSILVVDDIFESGATYEYLAQRWPHVTYAFMVCRQKMAGRCRYRGKIYGPGWIDFPWERKMVPTEVAF